jgi:hypothetical protein
MVHISGRIQARDISNWFLAAYDTPWQLKATQVVQKSRKEIVLQLNYASINFSSCFVSSNPSPEVGFLVGFRP